MGSVMTKVTQEAEHWTGNSKGLILLPILLPLSKILNFSLSYGYKHLTCLLTSLFCRLNSIICKYKGLSVIINMY